MSLPYVVQLAIKLINASTSISASNKKKYVSKIQGKERIRSAQYEFTVISLTSELHVLRAITDNYDKNTKNFLVRELRKSISYLRDSTVWAGFQKAADTGTVLTDRTVEYLLSYSEYSVMECREYAASLFAQPLEYLAMLQQAEGYMAMDQTERDDLEYGITDELRPKLSLFKIKALVDDVEDIPGLAYEDKVRRLRDSIKLKVTSSLEVASKKLFEDLQIMSAETDQIIIGKIVPSQSRLYARIAEQNNG